MGEWATTTFGRASGAEIELFEEVHFPHSLGFLYSAVTAYLGFEVNDGEYKVMGLAPYGEPRHADAIRALVASEEGGQYRLRLEYFDFLRRNRMFSERLIEALGQPPRPPESEISGFHQDVAASLQRVLEEVLLEKVRHLHREVGSRNLCMAGGVALNCVANGRILREGPFEGLFIQPAAGDAGGCLGAAAIAHLRFAGEPPPRRPLTHMYWGPAFSGEEIAEMLAAHSCGALDFRGRPDELLAATVDHGSPPCCASGGSRASESASRSGSSPSSRGRSETSSRSPSASPLSSSCRSSTSATGASTPSRMRRGSGTATTRAGCCCARRGALLSPRSGWSRRRRRPRRCGPSPFFAEVHSFRAGLA